MPFSTNAAAVRTEFLTAFTSDPPWAINATPFTPNKGAPPNSEGSVFLISSLNAPLRRTRPKIAKGMLANLVLDQLQHGEAKSFAKFKQNVSDKPVAHEDVRISLRQVSAFQMSQIV
jgi:hypothetical protein